MNSLSLLTLFLVHFASFVAVAGSGGSGLAPRALTIDTCAYLDFNLFAQLPVVTTGNGQVQICLCLSVARQGVQANAVARAAVQLLTPLLGTSLAEDTVAAVFLSLLRRNGQTCQYPLHSTPVCQPSDPCSFGCTDGYSRVGNACVCPSPNIECNGVCQSQACSSGLPQNPGKRSTAEQAVAHLRILTDERCTRSQRLCGSGGVRNRGGKNWECIDTTRTLDSCGGCMYPFALDAHSVQGVDCSSLPGVASVECQSGSCLVHGCEPGWFISPSKSECLLEKNKTWPFLRT